MSFTITFTTCAAAAISATSNGTTTTTWAASSTWAHPTNEAALRRVDVDRAAA